MEGSLGSGEGVATGAGNATAGVGSADLVGGGGRALLLLLAGTPSAAAADAACACADKLHAASSMARLVVQASSCGRGSLQLVAWLPLLLEAVHAHVSPRSGRGELGLGLLVCCVVGRETDGMQLSPCHALLHG